MRWFWIDRYVEFEAGVQATAIKTVTLAEEHLHDHFPGAPVMPNSLILEGLAQTGGLLVAQQADFARNVVLAKVSRATFHLPALPGDTLRYRAKIENLKVEGASVSLTSHIGDRLQAEADVFFAYVDDIGAGQQVFPPEIFANWLTMLRLFEVARDSHGRPIAPPQLFQPGAQPVSSGENDAGANRNLANNNVEGHVKNGGGHGNNAGGNGNNAVGHGASSHAESPTAHKSPESDNAAAPDNSSSASRHVGESR